MNCSGENCPSCTVTFRLDVSFDTRAQSLPASDRRNTITITSKDLVCESHAGSVTVAHFLGTDEEESTHDDGIAIVKIGKKQTLRLVAYAHLGIAKEHAKWSPVATASYRFWPVVSINHEAVKRLSREQKESLVNICPDKVLMLDPVTGEMTTSPDFEYKATFTEDLHYFQQTLKRAPEDEDFVQIVQSEDRFIFTVESTGCMDAEEIVKSGLNVLANKINDLAKNVSETMKDV